jgi:hypothetical protein
VRSISGEVRYAERVARPPNIPQARPRLQSKRYGLRFERLVARATGGVHGAWWKFHDREGAHYCQTDVLMALGGTCYVLECKLTDVEQAYAQLSGLYVPVLARALGGPVSGIIVVRHLTRKSELSRVVPTLRAAIDAASASFFPTLHWLGKGPI